MSQPETTTPAVEISFKAAWDVWRIDIRFDALEPEIKAAIRCGFIAGWRARAAQDV